MNPIAEVEKRINKRPYEKTVTLPVSLVEALIDHKNDADRLTEQAAILKRRLKYYEEGYATSKTEVRTLRKELNRMRKEAELHGH